VAGDGFLPSPCARCYATLCSSGTERVRNKWSVFVVARKRDVVTYMPFAAHIESSQAAIV